MNSPSTISFRQGPSHAEYRSETRNTPQKSLVDPSYEVSDPNPDIYVLFSTFNKRFFWGKLDSVEIKWSNRMTVCAGICHYKPRAGHCWISLSMPLLKLRPRKDLVETLLHEMIHAYLFVTKNFLDRDDHGPIFHEHMYRINKEAGTHISVYHTFHDEVKSYKTHWWKCDGPCRNRPPFYGMVKRSMNRAPGPNDLWWAEHQLTCGGSYTKIREPADYKNKKKKNASVGKGQNIQNHLKRPGDPQTTSAIKKPGSTDQVRWPVNPIHGFDSPKGQGFGNMLANKGSGTLVLTNGGRNGNVQSGGSTAEPSFKPFSGSGQTLGGGTVGRSGSRLLNTYSSFSSSPHSLGNRYTNMRCPVCGIEVPPLLGPRHVMNCLKLGGPQLEVTLSDEEDDVSELVSEDRRSASEISATNFGSMSGTTSSGDEQVTEPLDVDRSTTENPPIMDEERVDPERVCCPCCNQRFLISEINGHLDQCLPTESSEVDNPGAVVAGMSLTQPSTSDTIYCPNCNGMFRIGELNNHLDHCLSNTALSSEFSSASSSRSNTQLERSCDENSGFWEVPDNVENLAAISRVFNSSATLEDEVEYNSPSMSENTTESRTPTTEYISCPSCAKACKIAEINEHLDECLSGIF